MSETDELSLIFFGLSGSGKTNFLVALDVILDNQADADGLVHFLPAEDRAYLQPLREKWLRGEELEHTSRLQTPPPHQIKAKHEGSGKLIGLHLPDLAGEVFDGHFSTRALPDSFRARLIAADGLLLFLHCSQNSDNTVIEEEELVDLLAMDPLADSDAAQPTSAPLQSADSQAEASVPTPDAAPSDDPNKERIWTHEEAARQVKLVDLLQVLAGAPPAKRPLKIAVIVSAWDVVARLPAGQMEAELPRDPLKFVEKQWPLLWQYLDGHTDDFQFRVFGVSARGGGGKDADVKRILSEFKRPTDRVQVVDGAHKSNDLSRPIRWLAGLL